MTVLDFVYEVMTIKSNEQSNFLTRYLPILGWLPNYQRAWVRPDLIAAITITALLVPEGTGIEFRRTPECIGQCQG